MTSDVTRCIVQGRGTRYRLFVKFARETDGRWIADIPGLPGVTVYGKTKKEALESAKALALRVIAEEAKER